MKEKKNEMKFRMVESSSSYVIHETHKNSTKHAVQVKYEKIKWNKKKITKFPSKCVFPLEKKIILNF